MSWKKNSVKSIRHIRLRHCFSIDVGLRLHGVPVLGAPPGIVPFNLHHLSQCCFWSVPLPSPLRRPHECRSTLIRFLFFRIWLIQFQLLRLTSQLVFSASAISRTVLLRIYCCHLIFRIPRRYVVLKVSILFSSVLVSF